MSQPAEKRPSQSGSADATDDTGRFAIDAARRGTVLPPRGEDADLLSLEDVGAVMELDTDAGETTPATSAPRMVSGVFSSAPQPFAPPPVPHDQRVARSRSKHDDNERAQIEIQDLSLWPDNPYAASSLVPPPRKPVSVARILALSAALAAAVGVGGVVTFALTRGSREGLQPPVSAASKPAEAKVVPASPPTQAPIVRPAPEPRTPTATASQTHADRAPAQAVRVSTPAAPDAKPVRAPAEASAAPATKPTAPAGEPTAPSTARHSSSAETIPAVAAGAAETQAPAQAVGETTEAAAAAPVELPQVPSREQVIAGFEAIQPALAQCAAGKHGVAQIDATIAASGRISYALVGGQFKGSAEGSCMARVVRTARFPQFTQATLKVSYPIAL